MKKRNMILSKLNQQNYNFNYLDTFDKSTNVKLFTQITRETNSFMHQASKTNHQAYLLTTSAHVFVISPAQGSLEKEKMVLISKNVPT